MKQCILGLLCMFFLYQSQAQTKTFKSAIEFNDYIIELQDTIGHGILSFISVASAETSNKSERASQSFVELNKTKQVASFAIKAINDAKPFKYGEDFKVAAVSMFKFYLTTLEKEYKQLVELLAKEEYTEQVIADLTAIQEKITKEEAVIDNVFQQAQQSFAKKHHIELEESELQKEIDKSK